MNFLGCGNGVSVPFQATCACPGCGNRVSADQAMDEVSAWRAAI